MATAACPCITTKHCYTTWQQRHVLALRKSIVTLHGNSGMFLHYDKALLHYMATAACSCITTKHCYTTWQQRHVLVLRQSIATLHGQHCSTTPITVFSFIIIFVSNFCTELSKYSQISRRFLSCYIFSHCSYLSRSSPKLKDWPFSAVH